MEIWKSLNGIVEFGEYYEVSDLGCVRSFRSNKILKHSKHPKGYLKVKFSLNGKEKSYQVHRLVALAFIPNVENKPQVNHKDSVRDNNKLSNLEWVTNSENQQHSIKKGLSRKQIGEDRPASKLTEDDVRKIRSIYDKGVVSQRKLAKTFGVTQGTIKDIVNMNTWKHVR